MSDLVPRRRVDGQFREDPAGDIGTERCGDAAERRPHHDLRAGYCAFAGEPEGERRDTGGDDPEADHHAEAPVSDLHDRQVVDLLASTLAVDGVVGEVRAVEALILRDEGVHTADLSGEVAIGKKRQQARDLDDANNIVTVLRSEISDRHTEKLVPS